MNTEQWMSQFDNIEWMDLLLQIGQFLVWVIFILVLSWLGRRTANKRISNSSIRYRARKIIRLTSFILIGLLALITFTGKVQYFSIAIGILSAGIAFALQEVILSVAGWISIFSTKIYKPGDRIEMNKVKGDVIDIGVTKTTMMEIGEWISGDAYTGRIVQISNSHVIKGNVHNYSHDFPFLWDEIKLGVTYDSDLQKTNTIIQETANALLSEYADHTQEHWKKMVRKYLIDNTIIKPTVSLQLTDNWVEFTLRFIVDYKKRRSTKDSLYRYLFEAIKQTNGEVEIASATFELTGMPDLNVKLSQQKAEKD